MSTTPEYTLHRVPAGAIRAALRHTSTEQTQHYLQGVYFGPSPNEGRYRMVATDGYTMLIADLVGIWPIGREGVILNRLPLMEAVKAKKIDTVSITFSEKSAIVKNAAIVKTDNAAVTVPYIDGTFPDYMHVVHPIVQGLQHAVPRHTFSPSLVTRVAASVCDMVDNPKTASMEWWTPKDDDGECPSVVTSVSVAFPVLMVVMPMRPQRSKSVDHFFPGAQERLRNAWLDCRSEDPAAETVAWSLSDKIT